MSDHGVKAETLASELRLSIPALLIAADRAIEAQLKRGGLESIRGMTTRTVGGRVYVSDALATRLRSGGRADD
jgi:hypothetical protein